MLKPSPSSVSKMGNSLIRTRFSSSRLHSISGTTQGIDMVPNNFQIELKGLPIATSQFTGVKHVTHRETGWENSGSKETGLEYDGFIVYVHFLNLGNLELELYVYIYIMILYDCMYIYRYVCMNLWVCLKFIQFGVIQRSRSWSNEIERCLTSARRQSLVGNESQ